MKHRLPPTLGLLLTLAAQGAPPQITTHPVDSLVYEGQAAQFSATSSPAGAAYQWRKNGTNLSGETASTLVISSSATAAHTGSYDCVISNVDGSSYHPAALLTVKSGIAPILRQNSLAVVRTASSTSMSIPSSALGPGPITYQWMKDGVDISGATLAFYGLSVATAAPSAAYSVRATNAYGSTVGATTVVTVHAVQQPNIYGTPFIKLADTNTIKPGRPSVKFNKFSRPRLRDGKIYFLAEDGSPTENGLYLWKNNTLSIIADESITSPDGTPYINISYPTEESSDSMAFAAATGNTATGNSLAQYQNGGAVSFLARFGDPSPGGQPYFSFYGIAKRGAEVYSGMTAYTPGSGTPRLTLSHWNGSTLTEELTQSSTMPSGALFNGLSGVTAQLAYDGSQIIFYASTNPASGSGVFAGSTPTASLTRILSGSSVPFLDRDGGDIILGIPASTSPNVLGRWQVTNTSGTVLSSGGDTSSVYLVDAADATTHVRVNNTQNFEIVRNGHASRWSNIGSGYSGTFGAPNINAIKDISAHGNSVAVVLGHSSQITDSLWLAHNSSSATSTPAILHSPSDTKLTVGTPFSLRVIASGGALNWQWQKDGIPVSGNIDGDLWLNPFDESHVGMWTVTVSNSIGSISSTFQLNKATTVVTPVFLTQPLPRHVLAGQQVTFSAQAESGGGTATYQWYKDGAPINGSNSPTLTLPNAQEATEGTYYLLATNSAGSTASHSVSLIVGLDSPPSIPNLTVSQTTSNAVLSFPTVNGHSYRLERSDTLLIGDWITVESFTGDGNPKSWSFPFVLPKRFFRIVRVE